MPAANLVIDLDEACWAVFQMCNYAYMRYLSEPLRCGEEHCISPESVHIPANIEAALDIAIAAFQPDQPTMRGGNKLFGTATCVFDAENFKFLPTRPANKTEINYA